MYSLHANCAAMLHMCHLQLIDPSVIMDITILLYGQIKEILIAMCYQHFRLSLIDHYVPIKVLSLYIVFDAYLITLPLVA